MRTILHTVFYIALVSLSRLSAQTNIDFELTPAGTYTSATAVGGWTLSSQLATSCSVIAWSPGSPEFAILNTPIISVPYIGNIPQSPLGGSKIARLNNTIANGSVTKLSKSFMVTPSEQVLSYAFAAALESSPSGHQCCEESGFKVILKDQFGAVLSCLTYSMVPGIGCQMSGVTFSVTNSTHWTNWQTKYVDLSPFLNTAITMEVITCDCIFGTHYGTTYFDARLQSGNSMPCFCAPNPIPTQDLWFCPGSGQAQLMGPLGYSSYSWSAPPSAPSIPPNQASLTAIVVSNPTVGSIYTLNLVANGGCIFTKTYTIAPSSVAIAGIGTTSTCPWGSAGSATLSAVGSGVGFSYTWMNSTNSVVSTASVAANLYPGNYTVSVSSAGSASSTCGTATAAVTIGTVATSETSMLKQFCNNNAAYLCAPTGSNYKWYSGMTQITGSLATSPCYTVATPVNGAIYRVGFTGPHLCRDSIAFTLVSIPPGSLNVTSVPLVCPGTTTGSAMLSLIPASGSPGGLISFSVFSTGTTSAYSSTISNSFSSLFNASGLSAGGTYSVIASEGSCSYTKGFTVTPYVFNYTVSPQSATLCPGNSMVAPLTFTSPPSNNQYSYSWSPGTFLFGTTNQNALISPTIAAGTATTITYSVVVTPSIVNCPLTKTISITAVNPLTPTIGPIPPLCMNSNPFTLSVNPPGGQFTGSPSIPQSNGVIFPAIAALGVNTFTYANSIGTCVAASSASFVVNTAPSLTISGSSAICLGQTLTLLANGASTYSWSNGSTSPFITISPTASIVYTVEGTNVTTNCSASKTATVIVALYPNLTVSGSTNICAGTTTSLSVSGANSYIWNNGSTNSTILVSPSVTTSYSVTGFSNLANCSDSKVVTVSVSNCNLTGVGELNLSDLVNIYPNPTNGKIFFEAQSKTTILLIDQLGKTIFEKEFEKGTHSLDLSNYANGVYFVKAIHNGETKITKLVKND